MIVLSEPNYLSANSAGASVFLGRAGQKRQRRGIGNPGL